MAEELIETLVKRSWVSRVTLDNLLQQQQSGLEQARHQVAGTLYAIDPARRMLVIQDILSGETSKEIALATSQAESPEPGEAVEIAPGSLCLVDPETGARGQALNWTPQPLYGLVVTTESAYLYPSNPQQDALLASSQMCLYPGVPGSNSGHAAYDLVLGDDHQQLFIIDREAGDVLVFSLSDQQISHKIQVRPQGFKKTINLAFDVDQHRVLMTDNQSFMLYILDLGTMQLRKADIGMSGYALGNLALSPDGEHLYLLTLKPTVELLYLHIDSKELIKQIPLKGDLYSNGAGDPQDLLLLTPEKGQLLLMTYLDEPEPFTPIVTVINTEKVKTTQRYAIKDSPKPQMLAFPLVNTMQDFQKSLLELLLEKGLITQQQLDSLTIVDLDAPDAPDEGQGAVPSLAIQAADPIELNPATALPAILSAFFDQFYTHTEIEFKKFPDTLARFESAAETARQFLEGHDSVEVSLADLLAPESLPALLQEKAIFEQNLADMFQTHLQGLKILLTRQEVLALIEKAIREAKPVITPPAQCPSCSMALTSWDCESCGLELDSPDRLAKHKLSSLTPLSHVPAQHLLFADPQRKRLLRLDQNRTLDWQLTADSLSEATPRVQPWSHPTSVVWLPNKNLLVVDQLAQQIYECGPSGQLKWMLNQEDSPDVVLNRPVKATYFADEQRALYLIVDQGNHRLLAVDTHSKIHWQYGTRGRPGSHPSQLKSPSDMQWTYSGTCLIADTGNDRVLEINLADQSVVRIFGPELGLSEPTFAQRLPNANTLIVDAGNYRVIELDEEGDVVVECFYFKEEMGDAMRIDRPIHAMRGTKKNIILMDEDKIIELLPHKRRLIWSSLLEHLAHRVEIQDEGQDSREQYIKSFYQYRMPTMDQIIGRLKNRADQAGALASKLMENFNRLLEVKRISDAQRAEKTKVRHFHRPKLLDIPIYIVDRTHRHIIRINRQGQPIWHYGSMADVKLQRPTHITETENSLLIADTSNQCVLEIDPNTNEVLLVLGGKDAGLMNQPRSAFRTLSGNTLVADQGNRRLIELNAQGQIIWEFKNITRITSPFFAAEQGTGTILYADWALQQVQEIRRDGTVIWSYGQSRRVGDGPNQLSCPEYAVRLPAGSTLIADTRNNRVIEVAPNRSLLWEYSGSGDIQLENPGYCQRLPDGHTLIAFDNYRQLLEVDSDGTACWHIKLGNSPLIREHAL